MRWLLLLFLFICFSAQGSDREPMIVIRDLYEASASSKASNTKLLKLLKENSQNNALLVGYRGAAIMIEANHVVNPISKWNRFRTGKELIEKAVDMEPNNIEMRYIRLTIQTNLPGFLRYSSNIQNDKKLIIRSLPQLRDQDLASRISNYLLSAGICTAEEIKKIKLWKSM